MTIDEAIEYYIKAANQRAIADEEMGVNNNSHWNETKFMTKKQSEQIISDNRQLAEWLMELKEAKLLLKAAVEDFSNIYDHIFDCDGMCDTCPIHGNRDTCDKWVRADEALKLIGGRRNDTDK